MNSTANSLHNPLPPMEPIDQLYQGLILLAATQRETNGLLTQLMQKPSSKNHLSGIPSMSYLRGSQAVLLSSQCHSKKLWCGACKKKTLVQMGKGEETASSQCEHLVGCYDCARSTFEKIIQCSRCLPVLHRGPVDQSIAFLEKCPVCSTNLQTTTGATRKFAVLNQLMNNFQVVVSVNNPNQCPHHVVHDVLFCTKREPLSLDEFEMPPTKLGRFESDRGLIPSMIGMSRKALEAGSTLYSRMTETLEDDSQQQSNFLDHLL
jgi:hypothetical protein